MRSIYFDWISCHLPLYEYQSDLVYDFGTLVTVRSSVFKSILNNNRGNDPISSPYWIQLI